MSKNSKSNHQQNVPTNATTDKKNDGVTSTTRKSREHDKYADDFPIERSGVVIFGWHK